MDSVIRREKLIQKSKVRDVFTPFSPVHKSELLSGRETEILSVISSINTPGQHALIYGNRGIGKSSLANVIAEIAKNNLNYSVFIKNVLQMIHLLASFQKYSSRLGLMCVVRNLFKNILKLLGLR